MVQNGDWSWQCAPTDCICIAHSKSLMDPWGKSSSYLQAPCQVSFYPITLGWATVLATIGVFLRIMDGILHAFHDWFADEPAVHPLHACSLLGVLSIRKFMNALRYTPLRGVIHMNWSIYGFHIHVRTYMMQCTFMRSARGVYALESSSFSMLSWYITCIRRRSCTRALSHHT